MAGGFHEDVLRRERGVVIVQLDRELEGLLWLAVEQQREDPIVRADEDSGPSWRTTRCGVSRIGLRVHADDVDGAAREIGVGVAQHEGRLRIVEGRDADG